ncbi:MAG TPA: hypothetical protein PLY26_04120, partial [Ferruginibacter sp.]|nr:hypothetical protein [Ferruginibacter sp.]
PRTLCLAWPPSYRTHYFTAGADGVVVRMICLLVYQFIGKQLSVWGTTQPLSAINHELFAMNY